VLLAKRIGIDDWLNNVFGHLEDAATGVVDVSHKFHELLHHGWQPNQHSLGLISLETLDF
jgi:hypothetical protein